MNVWRLKVLSLLLALSLLLTGCGMVDIPGYFTELKSVLLGEGVVPFASMEYQRPDLDAVRADLNGAIELSESEENTVEAVVDAIYTFYDSYDWFYTNYALADIHYSSDLTDIYWEQEYSYCLENSAQVDAMLEELYYALAKSPLREELEGEDYFGADYFASYEGENPWDETFLALLEQEAQLQNRYYELSGMALEEVPGTTEYYDQCAPAMMELLVELIRLRQEIADYMGYEDYVQFAGDFYYYREYTPQDMAVYLEQVRLELVDVYGRITAEDWQAAYDSCSERETYRYVQTAAENMGGQVWEAFQLLDRGGLYDISYGPNKYEASFEIYLTSYYEPFVFINPVMSRYDCLTFAHEFGHFCNDYASYGTYAGVDVTEVFSQGMEYLSLCYGENTEELVRLKMADSLCVYVEQAAYAAFEQQMYTLEGEALTAQTLEDLYREVADSYGFGAFDYDPREFVSITHFYTNPLYVISYVVSNDAALQLYQLEQENPGAGLQRFEENLATNAQYFLEFLESAGLESPFDPERLPQVRETFESIFG